MSGDIEKVTVFDSRIVQDAPRYAVSKGGRSINNQSFPAQGATSSQISHLVTVPSFDVVVSRAIEWSATCFLQATATIPQNIALLGQPLVLPGRDFSLSAFPLHQLVNTMSAQINNEVVTLSLTDTLNEILRLTDYAPNRQQRTCPTALDVYRNYDNAFGAANNPMGDYSTATTTATVGNGAWPLLWFTDSTGTDLRTISNGTGTYVAGGVTVAFQDGVPRVSSNGAGGVQTVNPIFIAFRTIEKICLSPFVFADEHQNDTGLFGVSTILLTMNMTAPSLTGTSGRPIRTSTRGTVALSNLAYNQSTSTGSPFVNSVVNVQIITPSLERPLPAKSCAPIMDVQRYSQSPVVSIASRGTGSFTCNAIQLASIPDLIVIYAKPRAYAANEGDWYAPIRRISLQFNNYSGQLANHTTAELYGMTYANGLEEDFAQWFGEAKLYSSGFLSSSGACNVALTGGPLVLRPGKDFLLDAGLAPGVVGQFTLQFELTVANTGSAPLTDLNLSVLAINSGFFETISGTSRIVKSPLTEADVLGAKDEVSQMGLSRYVGGSGIFGKLSNAVSRAKDYLPLAKAIASAAKPHLPEGMQSALSAVGASSTGGSSTGGSSSGGRRSAAHRLRA